MGDGVFDVIVHLGVRLLEPVGHKHRVPAKVIVPLGWNDLPRRAAVEDYGLDFGPGGVGKDALSIGGLVVKPGCAGSKRKREGRSVARVLWRECPPSPILAVRIPCLFRWGHCRESSPDRQLTKHLVEAIMAALLQEPFDVRP